jgi:hypothetical protein
MYVLIKNKGDGNHRPKRSKEQSNDQAKNLSHEDRQRNTKLSW